MRSSAALRIASGSGGPAAGRAEMPWPATNIRGPDHRPHRDQVAHREVGLARGAEIADRRDAGLERPTRVVLREKHGDGGPAPLAERARSGLPVPVIGDVRMEIDEARERRVAPEIDHLGACRHVAGAVRHADNPIAFDHDDRVVDDAGAVPELPEAEGSRLGPCFL